MLITKETVIKKLTTMKLMLAAEWEKADEKQTLAESRNQYEVVKHFEETKRALIVRMKDYEEMANEVALIGTEVTVS